MSAHNEAAENFVQRAGICLLNSLACQVEGRRKLLVGDLGAMEKMLGIIQERLRSSTLLRHIPQFTIWHRCTMGSYSPPLEFISIIC